MEQSLEQRRAIAIASARARAATGRAPEASPEWSGSILPVSRDAQGNVQFDSNAGVLGALQRAVTLPGEVCSGEVDPMSEEEFAGPRRWQQSCPRSTRPPAPPTMPSPVREMPYVLRKRRGFPQPRS